MEPPVNRSNFWGEIGFSMCTARLHPGGGRLGPAAELAGQGLDGLPPVERLKDPSEGLLDHAHGPKWLEGLGRIEGVAAISEHKLERLPLEEQDYGKVRLYREIRTAAIAPVFFVNCSCLGFVGRVATGQGLDVALGLGASC